MSNVRDEAAAKKRVAEARRAYSAQQRGKAATLDSQTALLGSRSSSNIPDELLPDDPSLSPASVRSTRSVTLPRPPRSPKANRVAAGAQGRPAPHALSPRKPPAHFTSPRAMSPLRREVVSPTGSDRASPTKRNPATTTAWAGGSAAGSTASLRRGSTPGQSASSAAPATGASAPPSSKAAGSAQKPQPQPQQQQQPLYSAPSSPKVQAAAGATQSMPKQTRAGALQNGNGKGPARGVAGSVGTEEETSGSSDVYYEDSQRFREADSEGAFASSSSPSTPDRNAGTDIYAKRKWIPPTRQEL
jgi:hypothetical protein